MIKFKKYGIFVVLIAFVFMAAVSSNVLVADENDAVEEIEGENIAPNATFDEWEFDEELEMDVPVGWDGIVFEGAGGNPAEDGDGVFQSEDAYVGDYSTKVVSMGGAHININLQADPIQAEAGESYYFSVRVKTEDAEERGAFLRLFIEDEDGGPAGRTKTTEVPGFAYDLECTTSEEWTEIGGVLTLPEEDESESGKDTESVAFALGFMGPDDTGVAYFDDVQMILVE